MTRIDRRHHESVEDSTSSGGSGNAAQVKLGPYRKGIQLMYNIASASDIVVEVSNDGSDWDPHYTLSSGSQTTGSEQADTSVPDTTYTHARAYYTGADGDITTLKIVGK